MSGSGDRPPRPTRAEYVAWRTATTRWADDDSYGHLNNAVYVELIDTAVNAHLIQATGTDIRRLPAVGVVAEVSCRYFAELGFPAPVDLGLAVERVGRSSVVYRVGLFQGQEDPDQDDPDQDDPGQGACAEGRFVHVYVENRPAGDARAPGAGPGPATRRKVVPVPEPVRAAATALQVGRVGG